MFIKLLVNVAAIPMSEHTLLGIVCVTMGKGYTVSVTLTGKELQPLAFPVKVAVACKEEPPLFSMINSMLS